MEELSKSIHRGCVVPGSGIIINPGTGPVEDHSEEEAFKNIPAFIADLELEGVTFGRMRGMDGGGGRNGRYAFALLKGDRACMVDMPGIPLERVRYLHRPDQDIWDFPRLYVDGSSWVWCYGLSSARRALTGEEDD